MVDVTLKTLSSSLVPSAYSTILVLAIAAMGGFLSSYWSKPVTAVSFSLVLDENPAITDKIFYPAGGSNLYQVFTRFSLVAESKPFFMFCNNWFDESEDFPSDYNSYMSGLKFDYFELSTMLGVQFRHTDIKVATEFPRLFPRCLHEYVQLNRIKKAEFDLAHINAVNPANSHSSKAKGELMSERFRRASLVGLPLKWEVVSYKAPKTLNRLYFFGIYTLQYAILLLGALVAHHFFEYWLNIKQRTRGE